MYTLEYTNQYKKDLRKVAKRGLDINLMFDVLKQLEQNGQVDKRHRPHKLTNNWAGFWECHVSPDWLLVYKVAETIQVVRLVRTGTHSDLF